MQLLQKQISVVAAVVFVTTLAAPARGEIDVIEAYTATNDGGMTRDSLSDANLTQTKTARTVRRTVALRRRARTDPKDFVATRSHHHSHHGKDTASRAASSRTTPKNRGPVVGFVYWWNGWVIRTLHTKFGTVLLGTVGAKS